MHDYGVGYSVSDYLFGSESDFEVTDWTITNPPFRLAEDFIERALCLSRVGVAVIVRSAFLEGQGRYYRLFGDNPPSQVLQFTERVVMHKGRLSPKGSTATAYAWLVWLKGGPPPVVTRLGWIAPTKDRLEVPSDYAELNCVSSDCPMFDFEGSAKLVME